MSRIIALMGRGGSGKTTTLNMLPAILHLNGYTPVPGTRQNYGPDFLEIYTNGKLTVGISSRGDGYQEVFDGLTTLTSAGCDVCICASRTSGGTHVAIHGFTGHTPHFQHKTYAASPIHELAVNTADANTLFTLI